MGEHQTWFDFLGHVPAWNHFTQTMQGYMGRTFQFGPLAGTHFTLNHILFALLVLGFVAYGAIRFRRAYSGGNLVPPARINLRNVFEMMCDAVFSLMNGIMGEKYAKKFFPLIASLAFFILFST